MECCLCKAPGKYKCPECGYRTCSADCVKNHKIVYGCTGVAKPLKFIPLKEFTDTKLQKDMNFLMDIVRVSDQSYKFVTKISRSDNRKRFNFLMNECRNRGIALKIMPKAMNRHLRNTSLYDKAEKVLIWHIEWCFLKGSEQITCETTENTENQPLGELLEKALESFRKIPAFVLHYSSEVLSPQSLFYLISKKKSQNTAKNCYKELDHSMTLKELLPDLSNLSAVVEFPTLYIIPSTYAVTTI